MIFDLPFDDYREIFIARKFEGHTFSSNISYYNRNKKKLYNPNLQVLHQSVNLHNPFVFRDLKGHLNDSSVLALSSSGVWKQTSIQTNYSTSLSYRNTEWGLSGRAGLMHVSAYSRNVTLFTGKASINYKWQQKRHRHFIMATVEQMPHSFHQYNEQLTTLTPTTFNIYRYFDNPVNRQFTVNYLGSTNLKHRVYISLSSMYIRRYQPSVARYAYDRFIQTRYDSAIAYPADRLTGNVKMEMPVLFLKTKLEFSTSVHYLNQYLLLNNRLSKSHNYINNYQLVLKRNWHKTHYLRLSVNLTTLLSKVPSNTTHLNFNSQRIQWRNGLQYQYKMNKVWRLILEGEQITTKSKTQTFAAIGLLHFQLQITPVKSNFSFSILGDNLTNNRNYTFMQASPFMIYNSSVPMVHRNLQLRIHYSF